MEELKELWQEGLKFFRGHRTFLVVFLFSAILLFVFTRFFNLTRLPIFCDEAIYIRWAQIAWHDASQRFISLTDGKQPLQTWLTIPFLKIIVDPLAAGRAQAGMVGFLSLLVAMVLAVVYFADIKASVVMLGLVLITPYLLFFDRMALAESLLALFGTGAFLLSYLLGKMRRLDLALIAGVWLGLGLLVKSQALFFLILFPFGLIFTIKDCQQKDRDKEAIKFLILYSLAAVIALVIYNVQRLSPWMHIISQKNETFVVPLGQALKEPQRFFYNLQLAIGWFWNYLTPPIFIATVWGIFLFLKKDFFKGAFLAAWVLAPLLGESLIARVFTSRYTAFLTPILLLGAVFFFINTLSYFKKRRKILLVFLILMLVLPLWRDYQLIFAPEKFPFAKTDRGYLEGWTAGYGIVEIANKVKREALSGKVTVGTEGTFGLLSQGLEIYLDGVDNTAVVGYYPLPELPPEELLDRVIGGEKAYFLVNNTPGNFENKNLHLLREYPKVDSLSSLRLYEIIQE